MGAADEIPPNLNGKGNISGFNSHSNYSFFGITLPKKNSVNFQRMFSNDNPVFKCKSPKLLPRKVLKW